ncbi:Rne/Rng family ribonuclease [Ancylomarina longa]|uniref:Rne/Rng family ribonuclease n=1 Tax=Ancylomarina longa TaxID=2487017 RepID=A0A434AFN3_9BACT|nr:Rne/Rng family ribonuclease [Ancylomarina longa]RUT73184.1 Rne/Rng family ribonuclease [Ancylomarina longa]
MNNELVIDVTPNEIVIALLSNKQLIELTREKSNLQFAVGDIYLGKVKKIMPGLNAAFVDVGYEKDAFLHYLDLGHQFLSLNKFLQQALARKGKNISISKMRLEKDIDKNGTISDVVKSGQYILVQVAKEPISTKGPRLCSEISIAGRNLVLIPFSDKVSISQKIKSAEEKNRLKQLLQSIKPKNYGVIVRTVAEGKRVAELDQELRALVEKWEDSFLQIREMHPPKLVLGEIDRTTAILRDILNSSFENIYVNDAAAAKDLKLYISGIAPEKSKIVKHITGELPIFDQLGIDKQIKSSFGKTVSFKNGAYLIIEHTEAFHVIDVNSGNRSKAGNDQETNAMEVNIAAAQEIARQLRLRDMGGIIVVDFIDMHLAENRQKVFEKMKEMMALDSTKHNILPLSKFGLMQITRQRVRPEMNVEIQEKCPTCLGTGKIAPAVLLTDQIKQKLDVIVDRQSEKHLTLKVHPFVGAYINKGFWKNLRRQWQSELGIKLTVKEIPSYDLLGYKFFDKNNQEIEY